MLEILTTTVSQIYIIGVISFFICLAAGLGAWVAADKPSLHKFWRHVCDIAFVIAIGFLSFDAWIKGNKNKFSLIILILSFLLFVIGRFFERTSGDNPARHKFLFLLSDIALSIVLMLILFA